MIINSFIPVDIVEDVVESVSCKRFGSSGLGGTDSKALHIWLLKFGEDRTKFLLVLKHLLAG